jgi:hypothetical protein
MFFFIEFLKIMKLFGSSLINIIYRFLQLLGNFFYLFWKLDLIALPSSSADFAHEYLFLISSL